MALPEKNKTPKIEDKKYIITYFVFCVSINFINIKNDKEEVRNNKLYGLMVSLTWIAVGEKAIKRAMIRDVTLSFVILNEMK